MTLPKTMKAVIQNEACGGLIYKEIPVPTPRKGEVIVKMKFSPINPSDLSQLQGSYAEKPNYPIIPGIEGSGIVVKSGGGFIAKLRMGKRVCCTATHGLNGSWAEYMVTSAMNVIPIKSGISFESAASMIVNPLTAIAFVDIAKKGHHKVIFNNAAGGALGKMLIRLAHKKNIILISMVRSESQKNVLQSLGAKYVIDSSQSNYQDEFSAIMQKLQPTLILDAVGGPKTAELVELAPKGSIIMPYANLSESNSVFNPRTLLQQDKKIIGFFLGNYTSNQNILKVLKSTKIAQRLIESELKTEIHTIFPANEAAIAVKTYEENMSGGKILIRLGREK